MVHNQLNNTSVQLDELNDNLSFSNGGSLYYGLGAQYLIVKM
jgi:hypothetical protein